MADALEQLGYGAECATWRNAFLVGATELRSGNLGTPGTGAAGDVIRALTVAQVFDGVAIRIDGPRAWDEHLHIAWHITDENSTHLVELRNGALNHRTVTAVPEDVVRVTLTRPLLIRLVTGRLDLGEAVADGRVTIDGDASVLARLVGLIAPVDPNFEIIVP